MTIFEDLESTFRRRNTVKSIYRHLFCYGQLHLTKVHIRVLRVNFCQNWEKSLKIFYSTTRLGRIWKVAACSGAGGVIPVPGLSVAIDIGLLLNETRFYKSQLGLPDQNSDEFKMMTPEMQEKIRKFCVTSGVQIATLITAYGASSTVEEFARFIPFVGSVIAGSISFSSTFYFLQCCLNDMEETALEFLKGLNSKLADDMPLD